MGEKLTLQGACKIMRIKESECFNRVYSKLLVQNYTQQKFFIPLRRALFDFELAFMDAKRKEREDAFWLRYCQ
jgi:hypothetical protein